MSTTYCASASPPKAPAIPPTIDKTGMATGAAGPAKVPATAPSFAPAAAQAHLPPILNMVDTVFCQFFGQHHLNRN